MSRATEDKPVAPKAPRALVLLAAVLAVIVSVWLATRPADDARSIVISSASSTTEDDAARIARAPIDTSTPTAARVSKLRELQGLSETYRNTTFVTAIRDAGFVCRGLEGVYGGLNDSATWTVSCYEMLAYAVSVDGVGALHVAPTLQYFDSIAPAPTLRRDELPAPLPPSPLPR